MTLRAWARAARDWGVALRRPGAVSRAIAERRADAAGLPAEPPSTKDAAEAAFRWLCLAQDRSLTNDGGVARHYSLLRGWGDSYPETTGYIAATFVAFGRATRRREAFDRARRMLDWLLSVQRADGSFLGGTVLRPSARGVAFNTGQILLGLSAGTVEWGEPYRGAMLRAADWLVSAQDADGGWSRFGSPFALPGVKSYDTHAAWGLVEADRVAPGRGYAAAASANAARALALQADNGWLDRCCLSDPRRPLTHTLGYALRGLIEIYAHSGRHELLDRAILTAAGAASALREDGFLAGRLDGRWRPAVGWACLTGSAQLAVCWLRLHELTGEDRWLHAGRSAAAFVRRTVRLGGLEETAGAVKGAWPVGGDYNAYSYPNWAAKFLVDASLLQDRIESSRVAA